MLWCPLIKLSVSMILSTVISITLCAPQNEFKYTKPIPYLPLKDNVNNQILSFLRIKLQTPFLVSRVEGDFDTKINNIEIFERPLTPYPAIKPKIKYVEKFRKMDTSQTDCAGINLDCNNKKNNNEGIQKYIVKNVRPKDDEESNIHGSTTDSSTDFSLDTTTDLVESTSNFTTETDEYETTTEDLLNRMAVPSQIVASLLG